MDDATRFQQLEAELRAAHAEIDTLRQRESSLVGEVESRDHGLAEALEQQTATAEILRVIASSPTALAKVLDAIAASAARLTGVSSVEARTIRVNDALATPSIRGFACTASGHPADRDSR